MQESLVWRSVWTTQSSLDSLISSHTLYRKADHTQCFKSRSVQKIH